jgi:NADH-quinone oxidoreductase subunit M
VQRVFFGPLKHEENKVLKDMNLREFVVMLPIIVMIFWMGIYPKPWLSRMEPAIEALLNSHATRVTQTLEADADLAEVFVDPTAEVQR